MKGDFIEARRKTLLIFGGSEAERNELREVFSDSYNVEVAEDEAAGVKKALDGRGRFSAILMNTHLRREGSDLSSLRKLEAVGILSEIPLFLVTAEVDDATLQEAYRLGVVDVVAMPVVPYVARRRVKAVVELFSSRRRLSVLVERQQASLLAQAEKINSLNEGMIEALSTAIEFRSDESGNHVRRIHDITKYLLTNTELGIGLSRRDIDNIALASIMHDVGKISVPDAILNKPARLTPKEFEVMKQHTVWGANLLDHIPQLQANGAYYYARDIALHHHERYDGGGYPDGLRGDEISIWAQVVSIADVYDALSCKRVYKDAFPREKVISMITGGECGVFGPKLLKAFISAEEGLHRLYYEEPHEN